MRQLTVIICFQFIAIAAFGQIELNLYFQSDCDQSVVRLEFDLIGLNDTITDIRSKNGIAMVPSTGKYLLTAEHTWADDRIGFFSHFIHVSDTIRQTDTLRIP